MILTIATGTGYNVASPGAATGTISNDDIDVSLAVVRPALPKTARPIWSTPSPAPAISARP